MGFFFFDKSNDLRLAKKKTHPLGGLARTPYDFRYLKKCQRGKICYENVKQSEKRRVDDNFSPEITMTKKQNVPAAQIFF